MNQKTKLKRRRKNRCKNKVRYKSKAEANWYAGYYTAVNSVKSGVFRLINAYYCDVHHCWHLGNDNGRHKDKPWTELSWTMKREEVEAR